MASIKKRTTAGGDRWDVRWRLNGRPVERAFRRRAEAEAWKRKVESEELAGLVPDHRGGEVAFGPYAERWLTSRLVKGRPLSPMTVQGYRGLLERNLDPTFGEVPLRRITTEAVRDWYATCSAEASRDQAAKSYRLLRAVLNTAVDDDRIARNPCRIKGGGTEAPGERPMVSAGTVLALSEAMPAYLRALVFLAGFGGLRTGESLGLRRRDVDLVHGAVRVEVQAQQVVGEGRVVTGPKSEAGRRTVALPALVTKALEFHLEAFAGQDADAPVFVGPKGRPVTRRALSDAWRTAVAAVHAAPAGLHPHDLRHHAATLMARMPGVTTRELMARIGHSTPRAALIYQHATAERDQAIATFLDAEIAAAQPDSGVVSLDDERARRAAAD